MWPLFYAGLAVCAAALVRNGGRWGRPVIIAVIVVFPFRGLQQVNQLYASMLSFSPEVQFSNADQALVDYLNRAGIHRLLSADWGIEIPVTVRSGGRIPVYEAAYLLKDHAPITADLNQCLDADCLAATHPDTRQVFAGVNKTFADALGQNHVTREFVAEIRDSHGTPTYELYRLRRAAAQ
jgi:hypothetical protein